MYVFQSLKTKCILYNLEVVKQFLQTLASFILMNVHFVNVHETISEWNLIFSEPILVQFYYII